MLLKIFKSFFTNMVKTQEEYPIKYYKRDKNNNNKTDSYNKGL